MWRIIPRLYLGDRFDAQNRFLLESVGITHIVNCAVELPCYFRRDFRYLHLKLDDPDPAFQDKIPRIRRFIRGGRRAGQVLVHCSMGISRSPSAILAYLCQRGRTLEEGIKILQKGVGEEEGFLEPNEAFLEQLREFLDASDA